MRIIVQVRFKNGEILSADDVNQLADTLQDSSLFPAGAMISFNGIDDIILEALPDADV